MKYTDHMLYGMLPFMTTLLPVRIVWASSTREWIFDDERAVAPCGYISEFQEFLHEVIHDEYGRAIRTDVTVTIPDHVDPAVVHIVYRYLLDRHAYGVFTESLTSRSVLHPWETEWLASIEWNTLPAVIEFCEWLHIVNASRLCARKIAQLLHGKTAQEMSDLFTIALSPRLDRGLSMGLHHCSSQWYHGIFADPGLAFWKERNSWKASGHLNHRRVAAVILKIKT